ncbi:MAG: lysophospholipase [Candidatus Obscuribacterales bacterium]|nr:lysophospholipase [Candidatus Obscuribacterales bacterium]
MNQLLKLAIALCLFSAFFVSVNAKESRSHKHPDTPPCLSWVDLNNEAKAAILCVHGLGLHNGTYKEFGERMSKLGYAVYAVDVRGFGSFKGASDRRKVDFDGCLEDVHKTLKVIHKVHPKLPVFILGESMGGAIALRETAMYPELVDGLVSSVPAGSRFKQNQTALKVGLKLLTNPDKEFDIGSSVVAQATDKPELKEAWSKDPLARMQLSPKELVQFQSFMNENQQSAKNIKNTPVLMVQGCKDKLVKRKGTLAIFNALACQDKEMILIQNAEHLIFEEGQFDDHVINTLNDWLIAHLPKSNEPTTEINTK